MSTSLLVVFGATGQQGGSVIQHVRSNAALSSRYKIRGVARDLTKPAAQALEQKGIEVVAADMDDAEAVAKAVLGAHTVFIMTRTVYDEDSKAREVRQGKAAADAAVAAGAKYLILSSQCDAAAITGGKYPVDSYDSKAQVEAYVRGLPIDSAFFAPATFMQNFSGMMAPRKGDDGTYTISGVHSGSAPFPWLDVVGDSGKFVGAILAEPEKYKSKVLYAASCMHSLDQAAQLISQANGGKTVKYAAMPEDKYRSFLPPAAADTIVNMFLYIQDFGYYGAETSERVAWSKAQALGTLTTLQDYIKEHVKLE